MTHDCQNHNEGVMELTHDPLCPMSVNDDPAYCCSNCEGYGCECHSILKARADERLNALVIVNEADSLGDAAAAILMAEPPYLIDVSP